MASELGKKVSKAQKRLTRMIDYLGVEHDSIQQLQSQLEFIYGKEFIGEPHITYGGLSEKQRDQLENVLDTYLSSSYSTIRGFKKQINNKGFEKFLKREDVSRNDNDVLFWDTVLIVQLFNMLRRCTIKRLNKLLI